MRKVDRPGVVSQLIVLIAKFCSKLNVNKNMTDSQIADCAESICGSRWYLKLDDVDLAFKKALRGELEVNLDFKCDEPTIFKVLDEYQKHRDEIAIQLTRNPEGENNVYDILKHPQVEKIMTEVMSKMNIKERTHEPYVAPAKHPIQIQIDADWDALLKATKRAKRNAGIEMVLYKRKEMDYTEFYNTRFEEINQNSK